ncbi:DNA breaking-rejoining enzyme, partial [Fistulina hepatica ATCC 64428]
RTTRNNNWIASSPFRPSCPASEHIFRWKSPAALQLDEMLRQDSELIRLGYWTNLQEAYAEATCSTYGMGLLRFHQFCDRCGIPESRRMPADIHLLAGFIGCWSNKQSGSTLSNWLAGLRAWHEINNQPWVGEQLLLRLGRRSAKRTGKKHCRPPCEPVTNLHMKLLHDALANSSPCDAAIWACTCSLFWGCRRSGELTVASTKHNNPAHDVTVSSASVFFTRTESGINVVYFQIPWTKTTKEKGARVRLMVRDDVLCPRRALEHHLLCANLNLPPHAPLFAFKDTSDAQGFTPLTKTAFLDRCNEIWTAAGHTALNGHSFRIGGTVELLLMGLDPRTVALTGGWSSLAFLLYWHQLDEIIPFHTHAAYRSRDFCHIRSAMASFQTAENLVIPDPVL